LFLHPLSTGIATRIPWLAAALPLLARAAIPCRGKGIYDISNSPIRNTKLILLNGNDIIQESLNARDAAFGFTDNWYSNCGEGDLTGSFPKPIRTICKLFYIF